MIPTMEWLLDTPIAHRGLHDIGAGVPENSLAAFEAARDAGFPAELDVRLLRDGAVAVFHDENLRRLVGVDAPVAMEDSRSVAARCLAGTTQTIPLLEHVLDLIRGKVPLLIELKNFGAPGDLESAVRSALESYSGRFTVQSFNPASMAWFKSNAPRFVRGHLSGGFTGNALDGALDDSHGRLDTLPISTPAYLGCDIRGLPNETVASVRERGLPVLGWTVRSYDERRTAMTHCDNFVFEHIDPLGHDDET
jgi:glycerophosphoryl diester phosphodiesterase